ncbi:type II restriction enzyme [Corynebacterium mycetoides]|uniref:Type II restriction enzyme n=1 Tax=Corynebacterium mycetoides TaxID=38302 RepID=A0A1G9MVK8_9CORY|nr:DEAD/DEAH box helicase family protein [Corynebacterium mycetoides]SDL78061.1 type II restriction enzyme [Corynebacterium mycetoides]
MSDPTKIKTFREINPLVYSWTTPDLPKYEGWEKIGYTEQAGSEKRIKQQASQLSIAQKTKWARRALFTSESGGRFTDRDFHAYLKQQGIERELKPKRTEWHKFTGAPKSSLEYFNAFAGQDFADLQASGSDFYELRPEQEAAVEQGLEAFKAGHAEVLWNAKPRFGKTLATYDLLRRLGVSKVLIVTNRPAVANSWYDDFVRFIGHQTTFQFVSESASLAERQPMTRAQFRDLIANDPTGDHRVIEFLSLQDLKGSRYFGGKFDKLRHIADLEWDLLVVDEAHEGVDTTKTDIAFDHIRRSYTLHLSGTPFKALAEGKFSSEQIYNWTYADEREALAQWEDETRDNPYQSLPTLNMFTYQMSRVLSDRLEMGMAAEDDSENLDYAFDLSAFFATKSNGYFEHEADVIKFLDTLTTNEKYPFSTPSLRDEIRHSFWLLNRVASAKALERLLKKHEVFKNYTVILAAGDGPSDDGDLSIVGKSLSLVRNAIKEAEANGGRTITLSVGQLTTGVTVPEWTAVMMLSNIKSPALYMQAAFRAQNPCTFERGGLVLQKQNAYIFDFAPERTLSIYDQFANNLRPNPSGDPVVRQDNIRTLLNFFPVIGEDSEGRMEKLDASQVLTYPQVFKAREVVRRGFLSNLLFANVAGIFRYSEHYIHVLSKLPKAEADKARMHGEIEMPLIQPMVDADGNASVDFETVINPKLAVLGKPMWKVEDVGHVEEGSTQRQVAKRLNDIVEEKLRDARLRTQEEYGLTDKQVERDKRATKAKVEAVVEQTFTKYKIAQNHIEAELREAATEAEAEALKEKQRANDASLNQRLVEAVESVTSSVPGEIILREETRKEQRRVDTAMDDVRDRLRGFARTVPMFIMAYGDRDLRLGNFDDYTPDDVFEEITGITEDEFRLLRDGQTIMSDDGTPERIPGLFDETVFNQAIQEFLDKKEALADYFDDSLTENIFAYIPPQRNTSLVYTPQRTVALMMDELEAQDPGVFSDPEKTFADLFSTAGLFLMELVRRLDTGLAGQMPDQRERLHHILTKQLFEMSHTELLRSITLEAVSGGVQERKQWMEASGHYRVGNIAKMTPDERQAVVNDMLSGRNLDDR